MRVLIALCVSALAFAQAPLIGVNSTAAELPAGSRDVVTSITVDPSASGGDMLAVMLMAEGVTVDLELPDGRRVTKATAAAAGFEWEVAGEAQGDDALFPGMQGKVNNLILLPPKAPAGKYRIHADASGLKERSALMVVFMPLGGSAAGAKDTVRVALSETEMFHYAGETVELLLGVFDGNRGVKDARIEAVAYAVDKDSMPQGAPMQVKFVSSGPGADGSYRAELPTTAVGKYEVGLKVTGKYPGGTEFERSAGTSVSIEPRRAQILSITERPLDDDGNGLIDRIELTARIKVDLPGEYYLTVYLDGGMQARGKAELGLGEATITAMVDRFSLIRAVKDGPYKMTATLFRKEEPVVQAFASRLVDAGTTRAYKRSTFDHGPLYFKRTMTAVPRSATGQRPFQQLVVSLDVFTPGGTCFWSGALESGVDLVDFVNNSGVLPKGPSQITFPYDGFKISDDSEGKPMRISTVLIQCGRLHDSLGGFIDLPLFAKGTFVKATPTFELYSKMPTVHMERGKIGTVFCGARSQGSFNDVLNITIDGLPEGIVAQGGPWIAWSRQGRRSKISVQSLARRFSRRVSHHRSSEGKND